MILIKSKVNKKSDGRSLCLKHAKKHAMPVARPYPGRC